ncbi:MAG: hypothetical protein HQK71_01270 [Desulfamplus sp.]|nr:hypothetical protein [Desulfamplus sp.]
MSDFLQSIRGHQKDKRMPKTRRNLEGGNFNGAPNFQNQGNYQPTRVGNIKRPTTRTPSHAHLPEDDLQQATYPTQSDPVDIILNLLDIYTKNQERMINVEEKRVLAEERKAIALEEIAEYMRVITMPSFNEMFGFKTKTTSENNSSSNQNLKKDEILKIDEIESEPIESKPIETIENTFFADAAPSSNDAQNDSGQIKVIRRKGSNNKESVVSLQTDIASDLTLLSRDEVIEIIESMRSKGRTFDEVAQHLTDLGQPTFSGKGVWHAQTIHRICTRNEKRGAKSSNRERTARF